MYVPDLFFKWLFGVHFKLAMECESSDLALLSPFAPLLVDKINGVLSMPVEGDRGSIILPMKAECLEFELSDCLIVEDTGLVDKASGVLSMPVEGDRGSTETLPVRVEYFASLLSGLLIIGDTGLVEKESGVLSMPVEGDRGSRVILPVRAECIAFVLSDC